MEKVANSHALHLDSSDLWRQFAIAWVADQQDLSQRQVFLCGTASDCERFDSCTADQFEQLVKRFDVVVGDEQHFERFQARHTVQLVDT